MSQVTLYYVRGACSLAPHTLLCHLGIPFKGVEMQFRPGDNGLDSKDGTLSNADFRKINPAGYVPVLVVDGEVITEQFAVMTMIASLSPDKEAGAAMLGRNQLDRVRTTQWMGWLSDTLHSTGYGAFLHPQRYVEDNKDMYATVRAKGLKTIEYSYDLIDKRLEGRTYIIGEHLTVVDIFAYVVWRWGTAFTGIDMNEKYPAYGQLVRRLDALDGAKKAKEEEGLKQNFN
ncbi:glutathione S-transferase [Xylaria cf. heliscus]|nr:glutathione S-transferase [Xylaria cf. heliscus]